MARWTPLGMMDLLGRGGQNKESCLHKQPPVLSSIHTRSSTRSPHVDHLDDFSRNPERRAWSSVFLRSSGERSENRVSSMPCP